MLSWVNKDIYPLYRCLPSHYICLLWRTTMRCPQKQYILPPSVFHIPDSKWLTVSAKMCNFSMCYYSLATLLAYGDSLLEDVMEETILCWCHQPVHNSDKRFSWTRRESTHPVTSSVFEPLFAVAVTCPSVRRCGHILSLSTDERSWRIVLTVIGHGRRTQLRRNDRAEGVTLKLYISSECEYNLRLYRARRLFASVAACALDSNPWQAFSRLSAPTIIDPLPAASVATANTT